MHTHAKNDRHHRKGFLRENPRKSFSLQNLFVINIYNVTNMCIEKLRINKKKDMIKKTLSCTQRQKKHRIQVIQGHLKVHLHFDVVSDL
jgi:hypothetical protein